MCSVRVIHRTLRGSSHKEDKDSFEQSHYCWCNAASHKVALEEVTHCSWAFGATGLLKMFTTVVRFLASGARLHGFKSWFRDFLSQFLHVPSCKTGVIAVANSKEL